MSAFAISEKPIQGPAERLMQYGLFSVGEITLAIDTGFLSEVCISEKLMPMVTEHKEIIGSVDLRGVIVPVLETLALLGKESKNFEEHMVAILRKNDRLIGIRVDKANGMSLQSRDKIQNFHKKRADAHAYISTGIIDGGRQLNVLDSDRIFAQASFPTGAAPKSTTKKMSSAVGSYLTFEAGEACYGLEATKIIGTVPRKNIKKISTEGGTAIDMIDYMQRKVPVVQCSRAMGVGGDLKVENPEVVVVQLSQGLMIGLSVDVIRKIQLLRRHEFIPIPKKIGVLTKSLSSISVQADGSQIFVVDADDFDHRADIVALAGLSRLDGASKSDQEEKNNTGGTKSNEPINRHISKVENKKNKPIKKRFLLITAGEQRACLLKQIKSIIEPPQSVVPFSTGGKSILGTFSVGSKPTVLFDLAYMIYREPTEPSIRSRVVLVSREGAEYGFLVEAVSNIFESPIIEDKSSLASPLLTKFREGSRSSLVKIEDLFSRLDQISPLDRVN